MQSKHGNAAAPCHIAIKYKDQIIDTDSIIDTGRWGKMQFVIDEWFIWNMINNIGTWNPTFDRNYINHIESRLGIELKDKDDKTGTTLYDRARIYFGRFYDDF